MSKVNNSAIQTLIDIHTMSLEEFTRAHKSIKDASKIIVESMRLNGISTGEPLEIIFITDSERAVQKAMLKYYNDLIEETQHRIDLLKEEAATMKVFREHRGVLVESLATTIECPNGLSDIKAHYKDSILRHYIKDMYIQENIIPDDRLPYVWGGKSYNVIARSVENDFEFVIGQCNFYEQQL